MGAMATIGLDLAKNVFQVHGVDSDGKVLVRRQLRRGDVLEYFEGSPPCLVGMEACATSHRKGTIIPTRIVRPGFFRSPVPTPKTEPCAVAGDNVVAQHQGQCAGRVLHLAHRN